MTVKLILIIMRSNIRQVAEQAGVSRTTVSNVLLGRHDIVAPEKRELVLRAVRDLNYVPVRPALQNRHQETRVIAAPMDDPRKIGWVINSGTYSGMCQSALDNGYDVLILLRRDPDWAADRSEVQFLDRRSDGIIFASPTIGETTDTFEILARNKIPTVVCYRRNLPAGVAWVDPDNKGAMFGAVAHLVAKGHKKIVHVTKQGGFGFDNVARARHFVEAVTQYGLKECADWIIPVPFYATTSTLALEVMATGATAVVCMNDLLAIDLIKAMKAAGLSVPDDLSIIGVDGVEAEDYGLTSMEFSFSEIGREAVNAMVDVLQGKPADQCGRVVPVRLVERQTVKDLTIKSSDV